MQPTYIRGSKIRFELQFFDINKNLIVPAAPVIHINYVITKYTRSTVNIALTLSNNFYVTDWDSGVSYPGEIYWSAESGSTDINKISYDGIFSLSANPANPVPVVVP